MQKGKSKKPKPRRMCPFCHIRFADLRRHIQKSKKHENEPKLKAMSTMSSKQRHEAFSTFRKEGIVEANKRNMSKNISVELEGERTSEGPKVKCSNCSGIYNTKYFWKHRQNCTKESSVAAAVSANEKNTEKGEKQKKWNSLTDRMKKDEYHEVIMDNPTIITIGKDLFNPRPNKEREARHKSTQAMRRLAKLYKIVNIEGEAIQLFNVDNYSKLEIAIETLCNGNDKPGLKVALGILLKTACKILIPHLVLQHRSEILEQVKTFQQVLTAPTQYSRIFGGAADMLREKSQTETRRPKNLPHEDNYQTLWRYLEQEADEIVQNGITNRKEFIHARRMFHSMCTLLNGKRGSEASLVTITDWLNRDSWLTPELLQDGDEEVMSKYAVTFIMGKTKTLSPMFFQNKISQGLDMMCDRMVRKMAGVSPLNNFLFPYTGYSDDSCIGYNELDAVCKEIGIPRITATPNRHRASTLMWNMELEDERIIQFLRHIGHNMATDRDIYACPPAAKALRTVAPILENIKAVSLFYSFIKVVHG